MVDFSKIETEDVLICRFPAHENEYWEDIIEEDRKYVEWLVSGEGPELSDKLYDHLMELLEA